MLDDGTVGRVSNLIPEGTVEDDSPMSLSEYLQTAEIDENLFFFSVQQLLLLKLPKSYEL
jgi:hypothetical protein